MQTQTLKFDQEYTAPEGGAFVYAYAYAHLGGRGSILIQNLSGTDNVIAGASVHLWNVDGGDSWNQYNSCSAFINPGQSFKILRETTENQVDYTAYWVPVS